MKLLKSCFLLLLSFQIVFCEWTEEQYQIFERDLIELADSYFPFEVQHVTKQQKQQQQQLQAQKLQQQERQQQQSSFTQNKQVYNQNNIREKRQVDCPGGNGNYGFNSYNLMTFIVLSFNAVSNAIANVNNNDNNNNNNNNKNDIGSVSGTSQDTSVGSSSMTMVVVIVPPIGPPIPVLLGRALLPSHVNISSSFNKTRSLENEARPSIYLDEKFDRDGVFFEVEDSESKNPKIIYPNGTIIFSNGTREVGDVFYGAVDSRSPKTILNLKSILQESIQEDQILDLNLLRKLNRERKAREEGRHIQTKREIGNHDKTDQQVVPNVVDLLAEMAENSIKILKEAHYEDLKILYPKMENGFDVAEKLECKLKKTTKLFWGQENCNIN